MEKSFQKTAERGQGGEMVAGKNSDPSVTNHIARRPIGLKEVMYPVFSGFCFGAPHYPRKRDAPDVGQLKQPADTLTDEQFADKHNDRVVLTNC
jgi:hypothetical protein